MKNTKEIFREKVIILLSKETDVKSNTLEIQDFVEAGRLFIPVFTSKEKLSASTQNAEHPFPKYKVDGLFLISMLNGTEVLRVNPSLADEASFIVSDLKKHFKEDIEKLNAEMNSKK
ncbi:MAG: SseB family protein [Patiriisocius sp.]|uniref:SseB family protein n=1 Tax=Patiriisocius sp. TaxID=2822396 RepID=UPI003EF7C12E